MPPPRHHDPFTTDPSRPPRPTSISTTDASQAPPRRANTLFTTGASRRAAATSTQSTTNMNLNAHPAPRLRSRPAASAATSPVLEDSSGAEDSLFGINHAGASQRTRFDVDPSRPRQDRQGRSDRTGQDAAAAPPRMGMITTSSFNAATATSSTNASTFASRRPQRPDVSGRTQSHDSQPTHAKSRSRTNHDSQPSYPSSDSDSETSQTHHAQQTRTLLNLTAPTAHDPVHRSPRSNALRIDLIPHPGSQISGLDDAQKAEDLKLGGIIREFWARPLLVNAGGGAGQVRRSKGRAMASGCGGMGLGIGAGAEEDVEGFEGARIDAMGRLREVVGEKLEGERWRFERTDFGEGVGVGRI